MVDVRRLPIREDNEELQVTLDDLAREGARRMIAAALGAEVDQYVAAFVDERDELSRGADGCGPDTPPVERLPRQPAVPCCVHVQPACNDPCTWQALLIAQRRAPLAFAARRSYTAPSTERRGAGGCCAKQ